MRLGILSDTHGKHHAMAAGVAALQRAGAEFFIHCGDVGTAAVLDLLAGLPNATVWGNTDFDRSELSRYASTIGVNVHHPMADLLFDGKRVMVTHGDDGSLVNRILSAASCDYLLLGHTHVASDTRAGRVRVINPGALHRTSRKSVATLDLATDELRFIPIDQTLE